MKKKFVTTPLTMLAACTLAGFLSVVLTNAPARAAALTWDANGTGAGQTDGAGAWLNADQWWDGAANATWASNDDAIFGNGGGGGAVTLASPATVNSLTLNSFTGTYTLGTAGQTITLNNGITKNAGSGAATIISPVTLGAAQSWTNNSAGLVTVGTGAVDNGGFLLTIGGSGNTTVSSVISNTGALTKTGAGQLTLSGANTFTGQLNIENGTVFTNGINNKAANGVLGAGTAVVLGASGQTGRLAIQVDGGISSNKDFTLATGGTGEIRFGNLGTFDMTNADRPLTLSGSIGGSGNLVKLGFSAVVLSGSNTYSGTTTVSQGPLRLSNANAIPGGIGVTGGTSALTINGGLVELTSASGNFLRGLGTGIDQFQIPGGTSGFSANGSARQVIVNNDPSLELPWGDPMFNPSTLLLNYQVTGNNALTLQNKIDLGGATRTIEVRNNTATLSGDIRTSSSTAGLTKTGAGTLVLSGNNSYNGPTTISAGTLTIGSAGAVGGTSQISLGVNSRLEVNAANSSLTKLVTGGGVPLTTFLRYSQPQTAAGPANGPGTIFGTVEINANNVNPDYTLDFGANSIFQNLVAATYTSPITLSGNASINSSSAVFTLSSGGITASTAGAKTLTLTGTNTGANTISGVIGNGSGTLGLTKSGNGAWTLAGANTYSGATTVSGGTLNLSGASGSILSSPAVTIAGGTLTLSNANAANSGDRLSDTATFTMNGGAFNFNNDASANDFSESINTLNLAGGGNTVGIQQAASGRTSRLTIAGLSRTGGAINFSGAGLGTAVDPRSKITFTSAPTLTDGIIGPWATVNGTTYATLSGNDVVAYSGVMTDVTRQSSGNKAIPDDAAADLRIIEGTGGSPANLTLAATTTTIDTLLNSAGTGAVTIDIASGQTLLVNAINSVPGAGALTLGVTAGTGTLKPATAGGNLLLVNSGGTMTVNSVIADNGSASTLTLDGSGTFTFSSSAGNNTHSGGTVMNGSGTLNIYPAFDPFGASGSTVTVNNTFRLSNAGNGAQTLNHPFVLNNGAIVQFINGNSAFTITGAVTGTGGVGPQNAGGIEQRTLSLTSTANTFTGPIVLNWDAGNNATISVNSLADSSSPGTGNINLIANTIGQFTWGTGAVAPLVLNNRQFQIASTSNATLIIKNSNTTAANTITINSDLLVTSAGNKTLRLDGANTGSNTFAGNIANGPGSVISVTKSGSGTWALGGTNTYSGDTTFNTGGTLVFQGGQSVSPYSKIATYYSRISFLDDGTGTISLPNTLACRETDNGANYSHTIFVGNNSTANGGSNPGSSTTGSTIGLARLIFDEDDRGRGGLPTLHITGANGYRLLLGDVTMGWRPGDWGGNTKTVLNPTTAPVTITGTVTLKSGATVVNPYMLELGGTAAGNLISGTIADPSDYPTNPNARALNLTKSSTSTWTLSGTNTYSGNTTVSAGTLALVGGSQNSAITVNNGATLEFSLGSPTTSTKAVTLNTGHKIAVSGTPTLASHTLMTAASFTGTPVLNPPVPGYSLKVQGSGTQLVLVANPPTTTLVIDLGTSPVGTTIAGGTFGTYVAAPGFPTNLPLPALPAGSILRSIAVNGKLEATDAENFASDLSLLLDPTPGSPGGDFSLEITSGATPFGGTGTLKLGWPVAADAGIGTSLVDTKTEADWPSVGPIDLSTTGLFLGNTFGAAPAGGTWSGTITLTYDVAGADPYATWSGGAPFDGDANNDGVKNGMAWLLGAANKDADARGLLPAPVRTNDGLKLTFNMLNAAKRGTATLSVEHSGTLGAAPDPWTTVPVPDANGGPTNGVTFTVTPGDPTNSVEAVILYSESVNGKLFGRLKATRP